MPTLIPRPTRIEAAGNKPKLIDEYIGHVNSLHGHVSIAHMRSPGGWVEPGQTPVFEDDKPDTLAEAMAALEKWLKKWFDE